jgi:hypothetical protein
MDFSLSKICFSKVDLRGQDTHLTSSVTFPMFSFYATPAAAFRGYLPSSVYVVLLHP